MVKEPEQLDNMETWKSFEDFSRVPHEGGDEYAFSRLLDLHIFGIEAAKDNIEAFWKRAFRQANNPTGHIAMATALGRDQAETGAL